MAKQVALGYKDILAEIKAKQYKPVYFLAGEEPYFIDVIAESIAENVLTEEEKGFNQYVCYGKDVTVRDILNNARRFPVMASHQVIIVKEAQEMEKSRGDGNGSFDDLTKYLEKPSDTTILVFCYKKKPDKRKKYIAEVEKKGVFFLSERMYDNQLPRFVQEYVREKKIMMEERAIQLLTDHIGNDLHRLVNELNKLVSTKPSTMKMITIDFVESNVGISKEFNDYELKTALIAKDVYKSNFIAFHISQMKTFALNLSISVLYAYFSNLMVYHYLTDKSERNVASELSINPFFVKEYSLGARNYNARKTMNVISILREYDAKSKGVACMTPQGELLKEMVYKILH